MTVSGTQQSECHHAGLWPLLMTVLNRIQKDPRDLQLAGKAGTHLHDASIPTSPHGQGDKRSQTCSRWQWLLTAANTRAGKYSLSPWPGSSLNQLSLSSQG